MNFKGKISDKIKLKDPNGKTWQIEVFKSYNNLSLHSGWRDFVTANKIDENDLLVFKYSSSSSFDVLIFDESGYEKASALIIKNKETESNSESESESETEQTSSSDSDTSIRVFIPPAKISSKSVISSPAIRAENKRERNDGGTSSHAIKKAKQALPGKRYYVSFKLELSVKQQQIADEMASATQPGSKLFLKILSSSDLQSRLLEQLVLSKAIYPDKIILEEMSITLNFSSRHVRVSCLAGWRIPSSFARQNIEKRSQQISLLVANKEKVFPANYNYSENQPRITRGWRKFALGNNLKERDLCLFELKRLDGTELAIVVHVQPRAN
ncbi:B3 domain-containing protein Os12g0592300-like [Carex rostrata]